MNMMRKFLLLFVTGNGYVVSPSLALPDELMENEKDVSYLSLKSSDGSDPDSVKSFSSHIMKKNLRHKNFVVEDNYLICKMRDSKTCEDKSGDCNLMFGKCFKSCFKRNVYFGECVGSTAGSSEARTFCFVEDGLCIRKQDSKNPDVMVKICEKKNESDCNADSRCISITKDSQHHCFLGCSNRDTEELCDDSRAYGHCAWVPGFKSNCVEATTLDRCDRVNLVYGKELNLLLTFDKMRTGYDAFRSEIYALDQNLSGDPGFLGNYLFDCFTYDRKNNINTLGRRENIALPDFYSINSSPLKSGSTKSESVQSSNKITKKIAASVKIGFESKTWVSKSKVDVGVSMKAKIATEAQKDTFVSTAEGTIRKFKLQRTDGSLLPLSKAFKEALKKLNGKDSKEFYEIFLFWGTHMYKSAGFGARVSETTKITKEGIKKVTDAELKASLNYGSGAMGQKMQVSGNMEAKKKAQTTLNTANAEFFEAVFGSMEAFNPKADDYNPEQLHIINMELKTICSAIAEDSQYARLAEKCYEALQNEGYCKFLEERGQMEAGTCEPIDMQCISDYDCGDKYKCFFEDDGDTKKSYCGLVDTWFIGKFGESCGECCTRNGLTCDVSKPTTTVAELRDRLKKAGVVNPKLVKDGWKTGGGLNPGEHTWGAGWFLGKVSPTCTAKVGNTSGLCYCT